MSSIYRKGRDGYFYYQTYVFNPKSGKKDRRIFHSLGTKDRNKAELKQLELDYQYDNNHPNKAKKKKKNLYSNLIKPAFIIFTFISILFLIKNTSIDKKPLTNLNEQTFPKELKVAIEEGEKSSIIDNNSSLATENEFMLIQDQEKKIKEENIVIKSELENIKIPLYKVERVETLSGSFNQGKISITVSKYDNSDELEELCRLIKNQYQEFSNIIICIYKDTEYGKNLALGNNSFRDINIEREEWLAMFTYNSVEGSYFDSNPTGYLGGN